ncbi:MAG TPA: GAF domain-containing protein [Anaerolineae bacterium]|nr:GAF domain-containing protein [Anaerolineae bacterium]
MSTKTTSLASELRCLEYFLALQAHRDPQKLAEEALSILLRDFGATAGSLLYTGPPSVHARQGDFPAAVAAHLDRWEEGIAQRIADGPWRISPKKALAPALRPLEGTPYAVLYALILNGPQVAGSISLVFPRQQAPGNKERLLLGRLLYAFGNAVRIIGELSITQERLSQLSLFYQVAQSMSSTLDLHKVLSDTTQLATAVLDASAVVLMLVDEKTQELVFEYASGEIGRRLRRQRTPLGAGIAGWVATHGEPVLVNNAREDPRFSDLVDTRTGFLTRSVICAPIQVRGKTIGVLEALNKRNNQGFDEEDLRLIVTTANQAALAIENARLYQSLREERDRIIQAQENVRRQVARNLHDGTVQFLSAISMGIDHLERLLEVKPEAALAELDALRRLTHQATRQARLALFELRPLILETQGLGPALEAYVEQLQNSETFNVHLEMDDDLPELDRSVAATIFAIAQEAVNNAKKHASARDVWLRLSTKGDWLQLIVEDNGVGFDTQEIEAKYDRLGSIGLLNMRERAELIDGHIQIESNTTPPNSGTRVILQAPIRPPARPAARG